MSRGMDRANIKEEEDEEGPAETSSDEVIEISSDGEDLGDVSDEEHADDNENTASTEEEAKSPVRKRMKPSGDETNNRWRESVEANHVARLPLWGVPGKDVFNIGAQYVEGLSSTKNFKDFGAAGTQHFKKFKEELELVKSWTWNWGEVPPTFREHKMEEASSRMKVSLCKAVANFRLALDGATDPGNMIYKAEVEEEKEENLRMKKIVAKNLLVCLSYLIPRVVLSTRLALYIELANVLSTALTLGSSDKMWMRGVEEKWNVMVEILKNELPELVPGACPLKMSIAVEQVLIRN